MSPDAAVVGTGVFPRPTTQFRFIPDFLWQEFGAIRHLSWPQFDVQQESPLVQIGFFELLLTG